MPRKGLQPESLAVAALLHDAGKLSSAYLEGRDPFHNVTSALIALRVLDPAKPESRLSLRPSSSTTSTGCGSTSAGVGSRGLYSRRTTTTC
ncbi:MAG: hypothetical protein QXM99_07060 [Thermofilum sp.]